MSIVLDARHRDLTEYEYSPQIRSAISQGIILGQQFGWSRTDSATGEAVAYNKDWLHEWRRREDSVWLQRHADRMDSLRHGDALVGNAGGFPRDFESIHTKILQEVRAPLNIEKLIPMDRSVPLGAQTHTWRRELGQGEAATYRGGGARVPRASTSFAEETFPIIYIVCATESNHFDMLAESFAGRRSAEREARLAVRLIREKINRIGFGGDTASGLSGILTHPDLNKSVASLPYTSASSGTALVADLNLFVNAASVASGGAMLPNRLATSIRQSQLFAQTLINVASASAMTAKEFFLKGQEGNGIREINGIREFNGTGPALDGSQDAWFAYNDDIDSTHMVMVQPPAPLPVHAVDSFTNQTVWVAAIGGVVMNNVGDNNLQFATAV